jgi:alpha-L-fucosidase 2
MLVQSRMAVGASGKAATEIELLPALPSAWPDGSVRGLRTRGGFEVAELSWTGKALRKATLFSPTGGVVRVRSGPRSVDLAMRPGERVSLDARLKRMP